MIIIYCVVCSFVCAPAISGEVAKGLRRKVVKTSRGRQLRESYKSPKEKWRLEINSAPRGTLILRHEESSSSSALYFDWGLRALKIRIWRIKFSQLCEVKFFCTPFWVPTTRVTRGALTLFFLSFFHSRNVLSWKRKCGSQSNINSAFTLS